MTPGASGSVLVVTAMNPVSPPPSGLARFRQLCGLFQARGSTIDVLSVHARAELPGAWHDWLPPAAGLAVAPLFADRPGQPRSRAHLAELLRRMTPPGGYAAICTQGVGLPDDILPGVPRIHDVGDGTLGTPPGSGVDLLLAADEVLHQQYRALGADTSRLPLAPEVARVGGPGSAGYIGWPEPLGAEAAARWAEILTILASRHEVLRAGLLLDETSLGAAQVPRIYHTRWARHASTPGADRSVALGVFPGTQPDGALDMLVRLILRGCPVLTTPEIAERFEGRWALPTSGYAEGLAGWIQGWTEGRDVEMFIRAAEETRAAFMSDIGAMTAHVQRLVARVTGLSD